MSNTVYSGYVIKVSKSNNSDPDDLIVHRVPRVAGTTVTFNVILEAESNWLNRVRFTMTYLIELIWIGYWNMIFSSVRSLVVHLSRIRSISASFAPWRLSFYLLWRDGESTRIADHIECETIQCAQVEFVQGLDICRIFRLLTMPSMPNIAPINCP